METYRIALFHSELSRDGPGVLLRHIRSGDDPQVQAVVAVLSHIDADILVLSGIDKDANNLAANALADALPGDFYVYAGPQNRGVPSGQDLDGDGRKGRASDAQGYGEFRGQGGLAVLSRHSIDEQQTIDLSSLKWRALKGNIALPEEWQGQRLSTSAHWVVPVQLPETTLSLILWHGSPPVFDGPEDRNGRRNHDETQLVLEILDGTYAQVSGPVVVAGFANLDPIDGNGRPSALKSLLGHPKLQDPKPKSDGALIASELDGGVNARHVGDPALDTVDWQDGPGGPGNLRVDYVLPSRDLQVSGAGVFWPAPDELLSREVVGASRHRLVWVDVRLKSAGNGH